MDEAGRARLEAEVKELTDRGDFDAAVTRAVRGYGPEILGFLAALHRSEQDASDVFSTFCEDLWKGLPKFAWDCTLRTWAYTLARHASYRFRKRAHRESKGKVPLSSSSAVSQLAQEVRTKTLTFLGTAQKDRFAALRETLLEEDQALLILRVDRGMAWDELARVLLAEGDGGGTDGAGADIDPERLKKESARLRKRFQLVKEKLVTLGKKAGLIPP